MADHLPLHVIRCPPDEVFRIAEVHTDGRVVSASMPLGDWSVEADGVLAPGFLGVLIDSVLGYASMTTTLGRWSVTTAMTLDVYPALQRAGDCLHAEAQVAQADGFSGFAIGRVRSAGGELVAWCSQRVRFLGGIPPYESTRPGSPATDQLRPVSLMTDGLVPGDPSVRLEVRPELQNPLKNLHGGISMYACDRAVARALDLAGAPLVTTSLQVSYLRPVAAREQIEFRPTLVHRGRTLAVVDVTGIIAGARPAVVARASAQPLA